MRNGIHSEVIAIGTEHITSEYTTCQELPNAPYEVLGGTGGFIGRDREVIICGGTNMNGDEKYKECWSINKDMTITMYYDRVRASGIVIHDTVSNLIIDIPLGIFVWAIVPGWVIAHPAYPLNTSQLLVTIYLYITQPLICAF